MGKKIEISEKKYKKMKKAIAELTEQNKAYDCILERIAFATAFSKIAVAAKNQDDGEKEYFKVAFPTGNGEFEDVIVARSGSTASSVKVDILTAMLIQIFDDVDIVHAIDDKIDGFIDALKRKEPIDDEDEVAIAQNTWMDVLMAEHFTDCEYTEDDEVQLTFEDDSTASTSLESHTKDGVRTAMLASVLLRIYDKNVVCDMIECADDCYESICAKYGAGEGESLEAKSETESDNSNVTAVESDVDEAIETECKAECSCDANENEGE